MATALTADAMREAVSALPGWSVQNDALSITYTFDDFDGAMSLINAVADVARRMDHNPEWTNVYNKVSFCLRTHDAGGKATDADVVLAGHISHTALSLGAKHD